MVERLPMRSGDAALHDLRELRRAVERSPGDPDLAAGLAQAYFDLAMARGDPRYVGYAEALLNRLGDSPTPRLLMVRALLRQYRHDFDGGLADLAAALRADPALAQAQAWRGAILLVRADYAEARRACAALLDLQRPLLHGACQGLLHAYTGRLDEADRLLRNALARTDSAEQRLWLSTRLGEVAGWRGDAAAAEAHFRGALALGRDDGYLLAAWADFLLDQGRPAEAMTALAAWESSDGLLLRLAEAAQALGHADAARLRGMLDDRFAAARRRGETTHRAEEARFRLRLLGDSAGALALAQANYGVQREPRDARILLEAAVAAKDPDAATPARQWLATSGFADSRLRQLDLALARMETQ